MVQIIRIDCPFFENPSYVNFISHMVQIILNHNQLHPNEKKLFISHMVQIILFKIANTASSSSLFISHMVQIIRYFRVLAAISCRWSFISHMAQIIQQISHLD